MIRKLAFTFTLVVTTAIAFSQGRISGQVIDKDANEPIPFANVVVFSGGVQKGIAQTDFNGNYAIAPLDAGKYTIKSSYLGMEKEIRDVVVNSNKTTRLNVEFSTATELEVIEIHAEKIVEIDKTSVGADFDAETIEKMATRNTSDIVAMSAGTQAQDDGQKASIAGGRPDGAVVFVNGVKQLSSDIPNLPMNAIKELQLITGGVPAQYGDATSGVINIVTKIGSDKFRGGIEAETGNLPFLGSAMPNFQPQGIGFWNQQLVGINGSGPLKTRTVYEEIDMGDGTTEVDTVKETVLGLFFSGQYQYRKDGRPTVIKDRNGKFQTGVYAVDPTVEQDIQDNPLVPTGSGYIYSSENMTLNDLTIVRERQNVASKSAQLNSSVEYYPNDNTTVAIGGNLNYRRYNRYISGYQLMNYMNNPLRTDIDYNVFGRFRQTFNNASASDSSSSLIKNAYYQIQFDYTGRSILEEDETHRDNFFRYGHVGNFSNYSDYYDLQEGQRSSVVPYYYEKNNGNTIIYQDFGAFGGLAVDTVAGEYENVSLKSSTLDNAYKFEDSEFNPLGARFISHYQELNGNDPFSLNDLQENGLFFNGGRSRLSYGLWFAPGREYNGYTKTIRQQYRFSGQAGADVGNHNLTFGFEYEQRNRSNYQLSPLGLWFLANSYANDHLDFTREFNSDNTSVEGNSLLLNYERPIAIDPNTGEEREQSKFDIALREKLGITSKTEEINVLNLNPDDLSVDMLEGNDLILFGTGNWSGFNYDGTRLKGNVTFQDFFYDTTNRRQAAFKPIYTAFYLQDKFEINDLILRLGVRVDRYDANQVVLKDKYSTVYLDKVSETDLTAFGNGDLFSSENKSSLIQDDWTIYVDKTSEDLNGNQGSYNVVGFREGNNWYDTDGNRVADYSVIKAQLQDAAPTNAAPWFTYAQDLESSGSDLDKRIFEETKLDVNDAFQDFKAQINVMPRISFSFPVNDMATFFANYDVLTQRPNPDRTRVRPSDFYYLRQIQFVNNPDLKPYKQINYQLGFKQALDKKQTVAMTLSAAYQERKDEVQYTRVNNAFPGAYATFDNIDFSTVKRGEITFDTRRINNFKVLASYTIQFADGTGSGATTAVSLINAGQGNIKVPSPLDFDQRHAIKMNLDYRLDSGQGPVLFGKKRLGGAGASLQMFAGSGLPYSKNRNSEASEIASGAVSRNQLDGGINSSRLPWNNRFNLRLYKNYSFKGRQNAIQVYMFVQNLFNARNIINVYKNTGSPDDDAHLTTTESETIYNSPQAIDMYYARLTVPDWGTTQPYSNYSMPRRIRFGFSYSF